ncbi:GNAT family N-acetyltransferase [Catenulispora rubra]|uniref:GNAT family N-acetyltransferase n=1 Tax=Catenulispora rubra TaxID=280293 RepID=UPI0018922E27|nr:GNAT family N-acetyltransferase [Catenulispora rubra]
MSTATPAPLPKRRPGTSSDPGVGTAGELRVAVASADACPMLTEWAAANSWSPGARDFECYLAADPECLHIGYLGSEPVSAVLVVNHDADFAHLGAYMVLPQHRRRGYGRAIFEMALKHAGARAVGLHAVTDQVQNYKRSGFSPTYSTWRYSGTLTPGAAAPAGWIVSIEQVGLAALVEYDARHFRATRPAFLQAWISAPGHIARVAVDHDGIIGFGVIRPTAAHARIGPLYARNTGTARALLRALAAAARASTVALDAPETNRAIEPMAAELGLTPEFEMVTMYTPGPIKPIHHPGVFAVASAELG